MSGSVTQQYECLDGTLLCPTTFGVEKKPCKQIESKLKSIESNLKSIKIKLKSIELN